MSTLFVEGGGVGGASGEGCGGSRGGMQLLLHVMSAVTMAGSVIATLLACCLC